MPEIHVDETYDGLCTVTIGASLVITELTREEADRLAERFRASTAA